MPRRSFLKGALATGAFSIFAPGLLFAADSKGKGRDKTKSKKNKSPKNAGEKVRLACIGIGKRGELLVNNLHNTGLAEIVALCDTDMGAQATLNIMQKFPGAQRFRDFRQLFDKMAGQIDAVSIATPDFAHFPAAILAMSLGKHVYVEKPLAHTFREIDLLMAAEKKYNVAAQMGNQGHSDANFYQFKAWTEAGVIKNITRITAHMNNARGWFDSPEKTYSTIADYLPAEPIPDTLDWDCWLSAAHNHKYNSGYTQGRWRAWQDFGNGVLGDWGAHIIDTAHEFLELGLPVEIDPLKITGHNPFIFPQASTLAFRFPRRGDKPPLELTWYDGPNNPPPIPDEMRTAASKDEEIRLSPGKFIFGEDIAFKGDSHGSILRIIPVTKARDMAKSLPEVPAKGSSHAENFLLACKGREKCRSSFAVAGPLCQVLSLGVITQRLNAKLKFDLQTRQFTNSKVANELLIGPPPRAGWEQFYKL